MHAFGTAGSGKGGVFSVFLEKGECADFPAGWGDGPGGAVAEGQSSGERYASF